MITIRLCILVKLQWCCRIIFLPFRYFFNLLVALILIGTFNGLLFLPVLLSIVGPGAVVSNIPKETHCFQQYGTLP